MLNPPEVDARGVISRGVVACAAACCTLVALSFGLFAIDHLSHASHNQAQVAAGSTSNPADSSAQATTRAQPRRFIDGAAHRLTAPFRTLVKSNSQWAKEIASSFLALAIYGVGLGYLARWLRT